MERKLCTQRVYRHFKGNLYYVLMEATDSETQEEVVIYQALYGDYKTYVRPKKMFLSKVDTKKYQDIEDTYRFTLIK